MVRNVTQQCRTSEVATYPHRRFFGIEDDQFRGSDYFCIKDQGHWLRLGPHANKYGYVHGKHVYGKVPFHDFLTLECPTTHEPAVLDIDQVRSILCSKGLPIELAFDVMEFADYTPKWRLNVPHDPFHPSNREELDRYLKYCWQLVVRCDVVAKGLSMKIYWEDLVTDCISQLWEARESNHRKLVMLNDDDDPVFT